MPSRVALVVGACAMVACGSGSTGFGSSEGDGSLPPGDDASTAPDGMGSDSATGGDAAAGNDAAAGGGDAGGSSDGGGTDAPTQTCPAAPAGLPAQALAAYDKENGVRAAMGVPCASIVAALDTASADHCAYYAANQGKSSCVADPHAEVSGCAMFAGAQFYNRDSAAGYKGQPAFEDMAFLGNGAGAVQMWIDSIWHRTPVLSPWVLDFGYGDAPGCDTMDFGVGAGSSTPSTVKGTYPYAGQTGVPRSFDGRTEGPPPPPPPSGWPSGYPVTVFVAKATITSHTLTASGSTTPIAHQWIAPGDAAAMGLLQNDYVLYANSPLQGQTTYRVQVSGTQGSQALSLDWSFTTQ